MITRFSPTRVAAPRRADLQLIVESIPHIAWIAASDGSTEYFNRWGCAYTGLPAYGQDWLSLIHPGDAGRAQRDWERATRTESLLDVECRMRRADGNFRWHAVRSLPLHGDDGEAVKWIGTATDIDDRRRLQDQFRRVEREPAELASLEAFQSAAPVGLALLDRQLRLIRVNEALASINGAQPEQHLGHTAAELMPTVWPQVGPLCGHVLETGQPVLNQEIVRDAAAEERQTWDLSCYPVRVDGELIGIGIVVVDVTEQRPQGDELGSIVIAKMAEGLYTSDGEGRFTCLNPAAEKMLGWSEEELRGRPVHATIHFQRADGSPLPEDECELLKAGTEGRAVRVADDAFTHENGSIFPVTYSSTPLGGRASSRAVVMFRDKSEENAEREHARRELDALTWVGRTRDALDEDRLILYSQPIVPLAGDAPSEELLLRMIGPEGEIIRPATFLPAAEKYGLIGEIDQRVVTQAARLAAGGRRVQANLSASSISNLDLLPLIERSLSEAGADPSDLVFEITETALMQDVAAGEAFARGVAKIGCDLALDDFGTGYGCFTHLKRLPIKYLKIDIEFVCDLVSSSGSRHVIEAIIGLAKGFGQQTIAEGVGDGETLALLADSGVDFAQGYHLGRPAALTGLGAEVA